MPDLNLPNALAAIVMLALNAYVLLAGADFGGGVWDLLASGPRRDRQRDLIAQAIGPIWEANHVWLILVVVLMFSCFPPAFARLAISLHIPLTLMLVGVVLRGSAFTFRSYDRQHDAAQRRWGRIFSSASAVTPILLGICIGAVASGRVRPVQGESFRDNFIAPWLTPFSLAVGFLALSLFSFLAAVYLTMEARDEALREDFRRRALSAGIAVFVAAMLALAAGIRQTPLMEEGLIRSPRALALQLATALSALTALGALMLRRWSLARIAAAAQASLILWGWALAQAPWLIPPDLTIADSAAPPVTLRLVLVALGAGAVILAPSLYYLFAVFKSAERP
jgi:cytochrome d ubiquinol oxidase subunit II